MCTSCHSARQWAVVKVTTHVAPALKPRAWGAACANRSPLFSLPRSPFSLRSLSVLSPFPPFFLCLLSNHFLSLFLLLPCSVFLSFKLKILRLCVCVCVVMSIVCVCVCVC